MAKVGPVCLFTDKHDGAVNNELENQTLTNILLWNRLIDSR